MSQIICPRCNKEVQKEKQCKLCSSKLILNDRYYLLKVLGKNIGVTYLALDTEKRENVVIKELSIKKLKRWKDEELFKREAETLLAMDHPNIPKFVDYFEITLGRKIKYYTVMEFVYGVTLEDDIKNMDYKDYEVILFIKEIATILDYLHNLRPPIIHRDLKLTNIIRRKRDGKLVLIDFGAVIDALKPEGGSTIAGTFGYMAPEQFMGKPTPKSDYYSLGVIALVLLTEKQPEEFMDGIELNLDKATLSLKMKIILEALLNKNLDERVGDLNSFNTFLKNLDKKKDKGVDLFRSLTELKEISTQLRNLDNSVKRDGYITPEYKDIPIKKFTTFFHTLNEKEITLLEIILLKDHKYLLDAFYNLYSSAIKSGRLDFQKILYFNKYHKENDTFQDLVSPFSV